MSPDKLPLQVVVKEKKKGKEPKFSPKPGPSRLTVVETVYYQPSGENLTSLESRFSREVKSNEEAYEQKCRVSGGWQSIETGWVGNKISMIVVKNESKKSTMELRFDSGCGVWLIHPGESFRGCPSDVIKLQVRSVEDKAKFSVLIIPK